MHGYAKVRGAPRRSSYSPTGCSATTTAVFGEKMPLGSVVTDAEFCRSLLPDFEALAGGGVQSAAQKAHCDFILGSLMDKLGYTDGVKERQSFVDELLAYINENYAEDITLSSMAEHFGYSKYYFSRMFNAALGTSLTDYVSAVRMMRALDLMRRTGCTVSGGGFGERFQQPATFYRVLKKNYVYKAVKDLL